MGGSHGDYRDRTAVGPRSLRHSSGPAIRVQVNVSLILHRESYRSSLTECTWHFVLKYGSRWIFRCAVVELGSANHKLVSMRSIRSSL